jgi:hypothetical protein
LFVLPLSLDWQAVDSPSSGISENFSNASQTANGSGAWRNENASPPDKGLKGKTAMVRRNGRRKSMRQGDFIADFKEIKDVVLSTMKRDQAEESKMAVQLRVATEAAKALRAQEAAEKEKDRNFKREEWAFLREKREFQRTENEKNRAEQRERDRELFKFLAVQKN